jgi:putative glycosyltransferase (TIGR04372 family)
MRLGKLRSGLFLLYCYLAGSLRGVFRELRQHGPRGGWRELIRCGVRTGYALRLLVRGRRRPGKAAVLVRLCQQVQTDRSRLYRNPDAAFHLMSRLLARQRHEEVVRILTPLEAEPARAKCHGLRGLAHLELGQYRQSLADLALCHELWPEASRACGFNRHRAFLHGLRGDVEAARAAMRDQFRLAAEGDAGHALARFLHRRLGPRLANLGLHGSVGVFLGSYSHALGHAILDPFHYINLFRDRFDNLVMVHPDLKDYSAATRLTVSILGEYVETVQCNPSKLFDCAWQHLGELRYGNVTFLLYNYWALNRLAFRARCDPARALHRRRTYLQPSPRIVARAEALLRRHRLDPDGPLVVVHSRERGYHELRGQSYRDIDARHYVPTLRKLIARGYRVVRIGDRKMSSLRRDVPGLVELPLTDFYSPVLDPYLIWRCDFMMSCQSGPCSYARVFGKPNLVLNAVYHHTLLPEHQELIAFKNYRNAATGEALSVESIFGRGAHLFDRSRHFAEAGIDFEDMTAEEIEAAVDEMLQWLRQPDLPETLAQHEFRRLMHAFGARADPGWPLATPMTDYIGYALPECRISDAVAALRPGYLGADRASVRAA